MRSKEENEEMVVAQRLLLYNRGRPCGAKALWESLAEELDMSSGPSERTIGRILARQGLTHGRTGWYEGER